MNDRFSEKNTSPGPEYDGQKFSNRPFLHVTGHFWSFEQKKFWSFLAEKILSGIPVSGNSLSL